MLTINGADALIMLSLLENELECLQKIVFINKFVTRWLNGFGILALIWQCEKCFKEINRGSKLMSEGLPMAVFPEGTERKDFHNLDTFAGAFKLTRKLNYQYYQ